jgi:hypothetical protein
MLVITHTRENKMISIGVHHKSSNYVKGAIAEKKVNTFLNKAGFISKILRLQGSDIIAVNRSTGEQIKLEIKFSSRNSDGKYRATTIKKNATDHRKSDYIIFLCQGVGGKCTSFIIPTKLQGDKTFLCITSNPDKYTGYLAAYREAWHLIGV